MQKFKYDFAAGQTCNELGRCELAFLAFLSQHSSDKENIPLNHFFTQQKDTESDDQEFFHEVCISEAKVSLHMQIIVAKQYSIVKK